MVQLDPMQSVGGGLACMAAGADHVGITPPQGLPGERPSLAAMREIVDAVGDRARDVDRQRDPAQPPAFFPAAGG